MQLGYTVDKHYTRNWHAVRCLALLIKSMTKHNELFVGQQPLTQLTVRRGADLPLAIGVLTSSSLDLDRSTDQIECSREVTCKIPPVPGRKPIDHISMDHHSWRISPTLMSIFELDRPTTLAGRLMPVYRLS